MPVIAELDELSVVGFLNIIGAHLLKHVAEQAELPICASLAVACARTSN